MRALVSGLRLVGIVSILFAALLALVGFLVAHVAGVTTGGHGVAYALWIGGGLLGLAVGQSGSTARMGAEGRWGLFGQYWGGNPALPESPLWLLAVAALVVGLGVAVFAVA